MPAQQRQQSGEDDQHPAHRRRPGPLRVHAHLRHDGRVDAHTGVPRCHERPRAVRRQGRQPGERPPHQPGSGQDEHRADDSPPPPSGGHQSDDAGQGHECERGGRRVDRAAVDQQHVVGQRSRTGGHHGLPDPGRDEQGGGRGQQVQGERGDEVGAPRHGPTSPTRRSVSAVAIACRTARALLRVSISSSAGTLSATIPAAACT